MMVIGADTGGVFSDDTIRTSSDSSSSGLSAAVRSDAIISLRRLGSSGPSAAQPGPV
jgi:hypothetical protein